MRVLAVLPLKPLLEEGVTKDPCHKKKPTTNNGSVHSKAILQEKFFIGYQLFLVEYLLAYFYPFLNSDSRGYLA
jgi:hypothetical protein